MNQESRIKNIFKQTLFFLFFLNSLFMIHDSAPKAHAQGVSLGIAPPIIQIDALPGASIKAPITLENNADTDVTLQILLKAFTASENQNGSVHYFPADSTDAHPKIFEYIQFAENDHNVDAVHIAPKEQKTVVMHIGIPKDYPLDDHYFSIIFLQEESRLQEDILKPAKTSSQIPGGIATNVLLSLGPKGPASGQIVEFSSPFLVENGPVPFTLRLKNTSDHYITPHGEIMIQNMFGQTIGRVDLLPVNVLSDTTRAIADLLMSPDATPTAKGQIRPQFSRPQTRFEAAVWPEQFLLGAYTAKLSIALSDEGPVFRRTIYFFALPLYLLIILGVTMLIAIFIYLRVKEKLQ